MTTEAPERVQIEQRHPHDIKWSHSSGRYRVNISGERALDFPTVTAAKAHVKERWGVTKWEKGEHLSGRLTLPLWFPLNGTCAAWR